MVEIKIDVDKLKTCMEEKNILMKDLADLLHISYAALYKKLHKSKKLCMYDIWDISSFINVDYITFIKEYIKISYIP